MRGVGSWLRASLKGRDQFLGAWDMVIFKREGAPSTWYGSCRTSELWVGAAPSSRYSPAPNTGEPWVAPSLPWSLSALDSALSYLYVRDSTPKRAWSAPSHSHSAATVRGSHPPGILIAGKKYIPCMDAVSCHVLPYEKR